MNAQLPAQRPLQAGAPIKGIIPANFDEAARMARTACMAGYRPLSTPYGKPDPTPDEQMAAATMIILAGLELDMAPTQALEVIAMINGRRCIYGDGIPAILWSKGFEIDEEYEGKPGSDDHAAVCTITRPGGKKITRRFSIGDAKRARLWDERKEVPGYQGKMKPNDAPWYRFWPRMLQMRARGLAAHDGAADVLRGMRMAEEERDQERVMRDVTPQTHALPEIPDIPDIPESPEPTVDLIPDEDPPIADVNGLLAKITEDVGLAAGDTEAISEIADQYAGLIDRLPQEAQGKALAILEAAAP